MKVESRARSQRVWDITIDSDSITTVGLALLFIVCGLLLGREIRNVLQGHIVGEYPLHKNFFSIFTNAFTLIAAIYCFMFALRFEKTSVKIACLLVGADLARGAVLNCFHVASGVRHLAAIGGSGARQIALVILLVAMAQWFKSVIRWGPPPEPRGGEP